MSHLLAFLAGFLAGVAATWAALVYSFTQGGTVPDEPGGGW